MDDTCGSRPYWPIFVIPPCEARQPGRFRSDGALYEFHDSFDNAGPRWFAGDLLAARSSSSTESERSSHRRLCQAATGRWRWPSFLLPPSSYATAKFPPRVSRRSISLRFGTLPLLNKVPELLHRLTRSPSSCAVAALAWMARTKPRPGDGGGNSVLYRVPARS